ncbi:MAG: transposase [Blastocatellia bacterium]
MRARRLDRPRSWQDQFKKNYGTVPGAVATVWPRHYTAKQVGTPQPYCPMKRHYGKAIRETCRIRGWPLLALNVRTNHVHLVVSAVSRPEPMLSAFKANATRKMRESKCWSHTHSPWSDGGSKRYLWTDRHIEVAVDYVVNGQGKSLPRFD